MDKGKSVLTETALFGMLGTVTFAAKMAMAPLPNIEPVSLMVMLFAVTFGRKAIYPIYMYVALELLINGFGLWSLNYLYTWLILAGAAWAFRRMTHPAGWALLSGTFGLLFGLLCAPVYLLIGGWGYAVSWWISGIPFDILHCAGNFMMALLLFNRLRRVLKKLYIHHQ